MLEKIEIDPSLVTLELTESALMRNPDKSIEMKRLKQVGVLIAMDDFGTGYSSLSLLRRLPVDEIKIDRSFVTGIAEEPEQWAVAVAILRLARSLGKSTLAEGVETGAQLAHLRSLRCERAQGYFFSPPLSPEALAQLLALRGAVVRVTAVSRRPSR